MERIKTKTSVMFMDKHGILHKTVIENCHIDLANLKESDEATRKITGNKKTMVLYDARAHFTVTEDAMEHAQNDIFNKQRIATAIISDKAGVKIMVDYMVKVMKSAIPIKVFSTKGEGMKWLLSLKKIVDKKAKSKVVANH